MDGDGVFSDERIAGRSHPYGRMPQRTWCATHREKEDTAPVVTGVHPKCVTPDGIYDLEGGLKEWVGLTADDAGLKGGSYWSRDSARCGYFRDTEPPELKDPANGFRCCEGPAR